MRIFTFSCFGYRAVGLLSTGCLLTLSASADDEKITRLKAGSLMFTNVTILSRTPVELCITHAGGIANVRLKDLEPELQTKFGYDPAKAEAEEKRRAEAKARGTVPSLPPAGRRMSQPGKLPKLPREEMSIQIPNQGWKVVLFTPRLEAPIRETDGGNFVCRAYSKSGLILSMFVENPATSGRTHDDCFKYYWVRASRNPLIDPQSVQVEHASRYTKVTYRSADIPNANYYFCFKERWVDLHLSQPAIEEGAKLDLADFESRFRYEEE